MSKVWKWILGIVLVLVLIGAVLAIGFMWKSHASVGWTRVMPFEHERNLPVQRGQWNQRTPDNLRNYPMMKTRNFIPFGGLALLGGLVKLVLFFGLLYFAYWLGRRNARIALDPATASRQNPQPVEPVDATAAPEAKPTRASRKVAKKDK